MEYQVLLDAHLQDISWKGGSVHLTITSILWRLPVVLAGNTGTIHSVIAMAVATEPIATTTTWRLLQDVLLEFLGCGLVPRPLKCNEV